MDKEMIGKRLQSLREGRGLSQQQVADEIGITSMAVSQYETGNRVPRDEIKIKIARFYETTVDALFYA